MHIGNKKISPNLFFLYQKKDSRLLHCKISIHLFFLKRKKKNKCTQLQFFPIRLIQSETPTGVVRSSKFHKSKKCSRLRWQKEKENTQKICTFFFKKKYTLQDCEKSKLKRHNCTGYCTHWLPFQRFHALFHSLFKVLCIFPSRYLYAIGLVSIFSFRWSIPPT